MERIHGYHLQKVVYFKRINLNNKCTWEAAIKQLSCNGLYFSSMQFSIRVCGHTNINKNKKTADSLQDVVT